MSDSSDIPILDRTVEQHLDAHYQRQVKRIAEAMRAAAARIEREGSRVKDHNGNRRYVRAAADAMHELQAMMGNLPIWSLLDAATDAQQAPEEPTPVLSVKDVP